MKENNGPFYYGEPEIKEILGDEKHEILHAINHYFIVWDIFSINLKTEVIFYLLQGKNPFLRIKGKMRRELDEKGQSHYVIKHNAFHIQLENDKKQPEEQHSCNNCKKMFSGESYQGGDDFSRGKIRDLCPKCYIEELRCTIESLRDAIKGLEKELYKPEH